MTDENYEQVVVLLREMLTAPSVRYAMKAMITIEKLYPGLRAEALAAIDEYDDIQEFM